MTLSQNDDYFSFTDFKFDFIELNGEKVHIGKTWN